MESHTAGVVLQRTPYAVMADVALEVADEVLQTAFSPLAVVLHRSLTAYVAALRWVGSLRSAAGWSASVARSRGLAMATKVMKPMTKADTMTSKAREAENSIFSSASQTGRLNASIRSCVRIDKGLSYAMRISLYSAQGLESGKSGVIPTQDP